MLLLRRLVTALAATMAAAATVGAHAEVFPANPQFNTLKPSTTGIPGEEVRVMTVDPEGNLWIAGRWPFWSESAVAMLPQSEQIYAPLAGGGFETGLWTVWSSVEHPIPSPYIDAIRFTPDGVMWIGSEGGLTRFDRHAETPQDMWRTWNTSNAPLIHNGVRSIAVDGEGNVWLVNRVVNYVTGGLFRFNPTTETWTHFPLQGGNWDYTPVGMTIGADGFIYVTHEFATGFSKLNPATGAWTYQPGGTSFAGVMQDQQGNLWLSSGIGGLGGLWKWNGSSFQHFPQLDVTGWGIGLDGTVYIATWYGPVYKIVNGDAPQFFVDAQGLPSSIIQRPNGDIFINNYGSTLALGRVRHYTSQGQLLRRMNTYNCGLPDYWINSISTDSAGNTWFASSEGGLSRMLGSDGSAPTRWRNFGDHNDGAEQYPWAGSEPMYGMFEDEDGFIWMGGNGIGKWNPASGSFEGFWNWQNSTLGGSSIKSFTQVDNRDVWAATDMWGIYRYRPDINDWEQKLFGPGGTTSNYIAGLATDTAGNLWVATPVSLHFYNGATWFAVGPFHGSPAQWPTCLVADPRGGIWIGADNGLIRYYNGQWTHYHTGNSPLPINHIIHMDIRPDGVIGMTVGNYLVNPPQTAVVLFDGESQWQTYTPATHPFPHWQFEQVGFDADGDLWVSTLSEGATEIVLGAAVPALPGDVNSDGVVNVSDLLAVIGASGNCAPPPAPCPADLDGDGLVSVNDLLIVIGNWSG